MQPMPPEMDVIRVEVTQDDINKGVQDNCTKCPVALALSRAFGIPVTVEATFATVNGKEIPIPYEVYEFIWKFDGVGKDGVKPFIFFLPKN